MKMEYIYNLSLERKDMPNFHHLIPKEFLKLSSNTLEDFDAYGAKHESEEIIASVIDANIFPDLVLEQKDLYYLVLAYKDSKKIRTIPFIDYNHKEVLDVNIEEVLKHSTLKERNVWFSYFFNDLKKGHISDEVKNFILALRKEDAMISACIYRNLNYSERRLIKVKYYEKIRNGELNEK